MQIVNVFLNRSFWLVVSHADRSNTRAGPVKISNCVGDFPYFSQVTFRKYCLGYESSHLSNPHN